jgi:hypothetical protein
MRTLLAFTLLCFASPALAAQPAPDTTLIALAPSPDALAADPLAGIYASDGCSLAVARTGQRLVLTLAGQSAFDAFAETPADPSLNARAEALLRDAFTGSYDRLAAALPDHRREAGTRDFARLLTALAGERGAVESVRALGTTADAGSTTATLVRVRFAEGEELLKLRWRDGDLALITRGVLPHVTAHPVPGDAHRFAVLDEAGETQTLLVFDDERVTARRGTALALVAERTY